MKFDFCKLDFIIRKKNLSISNNMILKKLIENKNNINVSLLIIM